MTTCPTCHGKRIVSTTVPNLRGPSNNRYQSRNPLYVVRNYQCETCNGTGRIPATKKAAS